MATTYMDPFDIATYKYPDTAQLALRQIQKIRSEDWENIFRKMFAIPHLLEVVLAEIHQDSPLFTWAIQLPPSWAHFSQSFAADLLSRLSMFLFSLPCDTPRQLSAHVHYVQHALTVLQILSSTTFPEPIRPPTPPRPITPPPEPSVSEKSETEYSSDPSSPSSESSSDSGIESDPAMVYFGHRAVGKARGRGRGRGRGFSAIEEYHQRPPPKLEVLIEYKPGQGNNKRTRKNGPVTPSIDVKPFQALGISLPQTRQMAEALEVNIMFALRDILKFYLETLCLPQVKEAIRAAAFPPEAVVLDLSAPIDKTSELPIAYEQPSAFPMVQPMKAALYFESADGFGEWRILISTRASRDLREARRTDAKTFKIIIKKIKELSNGHFSDANQKRLNNTITDVPIYEAKMTRDSRLVYQVDCQPEYGDTEEYRQVLRVFGIYTHAELDRRFWDSMSHQLARNGKEYRRRCTFRKKPINAGDNVFLPQIFNKPENETGVPEEDVGQMPHLPRAHLEEIHCLLVLEKFVTFSQALLNSLLADEDIAHVFAVSPNEKEIIEHKSSCYVLGRSGTGKTTTMLFKMLGLQRAWEIKGHASMPKPRQIFVTQSRVLAGKVEEYFGKLMESLATGAKDIHELARLAKLKKTQEKEAELVDLDDQVEWRNDLPVRFSLLREEHFPLFITFDRLCLLLEEDFRQEHSIHLRAQEVDEEDNADGIPSHGSSRTGQLVSFDVFVESYWPHFPQTLTKGLDPSLVFSEFMGIIKGSEEALLSKNHFLDAQSYENLSHRGKSTFATQRSLLYSVFRAYLKRKRERRDYDAADRTHDILSTLHDSGVPGQKIDYLYVDEAQDNLLIDALLLRSISSNPDGLFWAGDTAQTISVGSSFRFDDLKSFLFRVEKARHERGISDSRISEPPKTFQLCANYRSHGGIVKCAHSVIELITQMWPHAIDSLRPEKGIVEGLKPVFFSGYNKDTVRYESFLFGSTGAHIEFGAEQCILVRTEEARRKLREEVGDIGLILTLYESKGLEFNDVLLYNFFEDSTVDLSKWRVVLNGLPESNRPRAPPPRFDDNRHAAVCSELKFLYVAVTRARKNLWILDSSDKSEPMRELWSLLDMIDEHSPGSELPQLAVASTPEEWAKSGRTLFGHKRYLQAMHCFQRAGLTRDTVVSNAYFLREQARKTVIGPRKDDSKRSAAFLDAAEAFIYCAEAANKEQRAYYRTAGDCYVQAGNQRRAAEVYLAAHEYTDSADLYRRCSMFDEAVAVIKEHRAQIVPQKLDSIIQHARLFYFKAERLTQANDLFESYEEALEYMEDYELDVARATLLEALGKYSAAAELHSMEGRTLDAIRLYLKDQADVTSLGLAKDNILSGLWEMLAFGASVTVAKANPDLQKLLKMSSKLNTDLLTPIERDEVAMFHAIVSNDLPQLHALGRSLAKAGSKPGALQCFDRIFVNPPRILAAAAVQVASSLEDFTIYSRILRIAAIQKQPAQSAYASKLFGFCKTSETSITISRNTFFHNILVERNRFQCTPDGVFVISEPDFEQIYRRELSFRLSARAREEDSICRNALAFQPCLHYITTGQCNRAGGCSYEHVSPANLNADWYNRRIRIHLQQIIILDQSLRSLGAEERFRFQQYWLSHLYEAMFPPSYLLGTPPICNRQLIPEAREATRVTMDWCRILLNELKPFGPLGSNVFLTRFSQFFQLIDHNRDYVVRAPCFSKYRPPPFMRAGEHTASPHYIINDLVDFTDSDKPWRLGNGVACLRHVIQAKIPIDINTLCTFIDRVVGSLILAARYRQDTIWHGVTLPRSWLLELCPKCTGKSDTVPHIGLIRSLIHRDVFGQLLEQIYSETTVHLTFQNRPLSGFILRNMYSARICRAICLVGYNINDIVLRDGIVKSLSSLQRIDGRNKYFGARRWEQLTRVVRGSTSRSSFDELIQLYHTSKVGAGQMRILPGVRNVIHSTKEIQPSLFTSTLNPSAVPFVPKPIVAEADAEDDNEDEPEESAMEELGEEMDASPAPDPEELARNIAIAREQEISAATFSEAEILAASAIQMAYRKCLVRSKANRTGLAMYREKQFSDCLERSKTMEWPHGVHYRQLLLGPLPHILVCLAVAKDHCQKQKKKANARFNSAEAAELEEVGQRLKTIVGLNRQIINLQKELDPQSALHRSRDLVKLKNTGLEVERVLLELPGCLSDVQDDLALGMKGIVQEAVVAKKKKKKPDLCVEDDELDFDI